MEIPFTFTHDNVVFHTVVTGQAKIHVNVNYSFNENLLKTVSILPEYSPLNSTLLANFSNKLHMYICNSCKVDMRDYLP